MAIGLQNKEHLMGLQEPTWQARLITAGGDGIDPAVLLSVGPAEVGELPE